MRVGIFADAHDHVDNVRRAVTQFNRNHCEFVLFAGDFCSPFIIPPLHKLACPIFACFGENDGSPNELRASLKSIGRIAFGPVCWTAKDGTRFLLTHSLAEVKGHITEPNVIVHASSHRPSVVKDDKGRLFVNPGETGGWTSRQPSIAVVDTDAMDATIVNLPRMPLPTDVD